MIYIRTMNIAPNRPDRAETGNYMVTYMEYVGVKQNLCRRTIRNGCLFLWILARKGDFYYAEQILTTEQVSFVMMDF